MKSKKNMKIQSVNTKNSFIIPDKIFEIIKFGNKNESLKEVLIRKRIGTIRSNRDQLQ